MEQIQVKITESEYGNIAELVRGQNKLRSFGTHMKEFMARTGHDVKKIASESDVMESTITSWLRDVPPRKSGNYKLVRDYMRSQGHLIDDQHVIFARRKLPAAPIKPRVYTDEPVPWLNLVVAGGFIGLAGIMAIILTVFFLRG